MCPDKGERSLLPCPPPLPCTPGGPPPCLPHPLIAPMSAWVPSPAAITRTTAGSLVASLGPNPRAGAVGGVGDRQSGVPGKLWRPSEVVGYSGCLSQGVPRAHGWPRPENVLEAGPTVVNGAAPSASQAWRRESQSLHPTLGETEAREEPEGGQGLAVHGWPPFPPPPATGHPRWLAVWEGPSGTGVPATLAMVVWGVTRGPQGLRQEPFA